MTSTAQGVAIHGTVESSNGTYAPLAIRLEEVGCRPEGEEGKLTVDAAADPAHSLKDWIAPVATDLVVPAQAKMPIDFDIHVPRDAKPGAYWGILVMKNEGTVHLGLIILGNVRGPVPEKLTVASFTGAVSPTGSLTFIARLRNDGDLYEKAEGTVIVRNIFGEMLAEEPLPAENVLPGYVRRFAVSTGSEFWPGAYVATVAATYGTQKQRVAAKTVVFVMPSRAGRVLVVLVLACAMAGAMFARRLLRPKIILDDHAP
jgi:hypothetical protein